MPWAGMSDAVGVRRRRPCSGGGGRAGEKVVTQIFQSGKAKGLLPDQGNSDHPIIALALDGRKAEGLPHTSPRQRLGFYHAFFPLQAKGLLHLASVEPVPALNNHL